MLPNGDLERLITEKRLEIEQEKISLGLSPAAAECEIQDVENKENTTAANNGVPRRTRKAKKSVRVEEPVPGHHDSQGDSKESREEKAPDVLPAELERYIRRYLGLPVMLKAGEYSPNNPLLRGERVEPGDVLLGLGEYERRRNTLRKLQQRQYREYLDQQAKKKQEEKERAERERREREEKERRREEERERTRQKEEEERRASVCYVATPTTKTTTFSFAKRVDTGVQAGLSRPLSVAVQTDEAELLGLSPSPTKGQLTEAERELSPRTVVDLDSRPVQPAPWAKEDWSRDAYSRDREKSARRRSYGDFDERPPPTALARERLHSDLRHSYMPSILDADAVDRRNLQAVKEAAERRQCYQQELKNQILEQQRIREERKTREKLLEAAEMRRLEEQLRMLRAAQDTEVSRGRDIANRMKESSADFENKRTSLQKEIDYEEIQLHRATTQPHRLTTSRSDTNVKLPTFMREKRLPYSTNIPPNSIFNPNYDVDSYLRKNLNPKKESLMSKFDIPPERCDRNVITEKALIHERPREKTRERSEKPKYEPTFLKNFNEIEDATPIPVLRHSPVISTGKSDDNLSEGMKLVDDKWKVPAVQKNILKTMPNEEGKNVSILTQLGSIRRQLQLEQLRLDNMITKRN